MNVFIYVGIPELFDQCCQLLIQYNISRSHIYLNYKVFRESKIGLNLTLFQNRWHEWSLYNSWQHYYRYTMEKRWNVLAL